MNPSIPQPAADGPVTPTPHAQGNSSPRIVLITARPSTSACFVQALLEVGYETSTISALHDANRHIEALRPHLVIFHGRLEPPYRLFMGVRIVSDAPILILGPHLPPRGQARWLNRGAHMYLPAPQAPEELVARTQAVLRRFGPAFVPKRTPALALEHLKNFGQLTPIEARLLDVLYARVRTVVGYRELVQVAWNDKHVGRQHLMVHMHNMRKKLAPLQTRVRIETVRGEGYILYLR